MTQAAENSKHTVVIENRESAQLTGICDVPSFNEEEIEAKSDMGDILIKGEKLTVEALDLESGTLKVAGKITAVVYSEKVLSKNFLGKFFS